METGFDTFISGLGNELNNFELMSTGRNKSTYHLFLLHYEHYYKLLSDNENMLLALHQVGLDDDEADLLTFVVDELGEKIEPYVLRSTPPVMSVGQRCMERGYTFIWPKGRPRTSYSLIGGL